MQNCGRSGFGVDANKLGDELEGQDAEKQMPGDLEAVQRERDLQPGLAEPEDHGAPLGLRCCAAFLQVAKWLTKRGSSARLSTTDRWSIASIGSSSTSSPSSPACARRTSVPSGDGRTSSGIRFPEGVTTQKISAEHDLHRVLTRPPGPGAPSRL